MRDVLIMTIYNRAIALYEKYQDPEILKAINMAIAGLLQVPIDCIYMKYNKDESGVYVTTDDIHVKYYITGEYPYMSFKFLCRGGWYHTVVLNPPEEESVTEEEENE